jgi:signal transduction histidine kinase
MMRLNVTADRLSRQELNLLLAQVARGAAQALREGVNQLQQPLSVKPPPPSTPGPQADAEEDEEVPPSQRPMIDALDDAIDLLSQLNARAGSKPRYGRFDLAAVLYDVAPDARIAIEPGAGTEVFGEETELRRMLHVLVNHTHSSPVSPESSVSPEVQIRRQNDLVRVTVALGPDSSATREIERRWLTRMAIRLGGRVELEAGTQSLLLPADGAFDRQELAELRRELQEAQQLGAVYARELAAAFDASEATHGAEAPQSPADAADRSSALPAAGGLAVLTAAGSVMSRMLRGWIDALRADLSSATDLLGAHGELTQRLGRRLGSAHDVQGELSLLAECPVTEPEQALDLGQLARQASALAEPRASRRGVRLVTDAQAPVPVVARPRQLMTLLRILLDHAIMASPAQSTVRLRVCTASDTRAVIAIEDAGPVVPAPARSALLDGTGDAASYGRPIGLWLLIAQTIASESGSSIDLAPGSSGGFTVTVRL